MTHCKTYGQRGVALIMALMLLMLLTALAAALVFVANMETAVNANYRREQVLYFAAKAGIEEARYRLLWTNATTLIAPPLGTCALAANCLPAIPVVPSGTNGGMLYIRGGTNPAAVTPWTAATTSTDDELCHDGYALPGQTAEGPDLRCIDVPAGSAWYKTTNSNIPWSGTAAALPYQWVRISWKLNGSVDNNLNTRRVNTAAPATTPICWDGQEEILLAGTTDCTKMVNLTPPGPAATPVYIVTSLATDPITNARRMVQAEIASPPSTPFIYGLYATAATCGALSMNGGATTDSFTSASGTPPWTTTTTGGDIGSNGNVSLGGSNTQVGGAIGVPNATQGTCPAGLTTSGGAGMVSNPANVLTAAGPFVFAIPPDPNPPPLTTTVIVNDKKQPTALVPGTYGNISVTAGATLVLAPGVYNLNSISVSGSGSQITVNPPGAVVLNFPQSSPTPINLQSDGAIVNTSGIPNNFQFNYGGTGTITISGGNNTYAIVNAPNATVNLKGNNTDFYGSVVAATISVNAMRFHYDLNSKIAPPSTGSYSEISFRDVVY